MNYPYYVIRVNGKYMYHAIERFQYKEAAEVVFKDPNFRKAVHEDWPLPRFKISLHEVNYDSFVEAAREIDHE